MKQRFLQKTILVAFFWGFGFFANSQPPPPPPPPGAPNGVPIDGALFLLLGAGLVYGARKLYKE